MASWRLHMERVEYEGDTVVGTPVFKTQENRSRSKLLESLRNFTHQELTTLRHTGRLETFREFRGGKTVEIKVELSDHSAGSEPSQKGASQN